MIRASEKAKSILKKYARLEHKSLVQLLDEAVEALERRRQLDELRAGYLAISADAVAQLQYDEETGLYDNASADGIE